MKSIILQTVMLVGFIFCSISFAQAQVGDRYKVDIPFDFNIGKMHYSSGAYTVEIRGLDQKFFVIRDAHGRKPFVRMTMPGDVRRLPTAQLDFYRIGNQYFLSSIRAADVTTSFKTPDVDNNLGRTEAGGVVTVALSKER